MKKSPDPDANFADRIEIVINTLAKHAVDCVIIGGVAVAAHGSSYLTHDFDIAYSHERENIRKIVAALSPLHPRLRVPGTEEGVAFPFDEQTLYNSGNFTLRTDVGDVDILAHVGGFFNYDEIKALAGPSCRNSRYCSKRRNAGASNVSAEFPDSRRAPLRRIQATVRHRT